MDWVEEFLLEAFILVLADIVLFTIAIVRYKRQPRTSVYTILFVASTILLVISTMLEKYFKFIADPHLTLVFAVISYALRPTCIYIFLLTSDNPINGKSYFISSIPLLINLIIYLLAFFPSLGEYIVYFTKYDTPEGPAISFGGGFLRYSSHIVSAFYLLVLLYSSLTAIRLNRLFRGLTSLFCSLLIIASAVYESFFDSTGDIKVLNSTVGIAVLIYFLYLTLEEGDIDELTLLYSAESFNSKPERVNRVASGVMIIQINIVHTLDEDVEQNSMIIKDVARIVLRNISRKMVAYRIEDERFLLVANETKKEMFMATFEKIKSSIAATSYEVDLGYAYKNDDDMKMHELLLEAEEMMKYNRINYHSPNPLKI